MITTEPDNKLAFAYKQQDDGSSDSSLITKMTTGVVTVPNLPTLYEHYTSGGIQTGLSANQPHFTLNNHNITLYSGAIHYFRVPQDKWRDRLRKARAAGLNTVETYVPWNLHEPQPGVFEWGDGLSGSDFAEFLNLQKFLEIAKEEDLLAIVRPGPFICSEWEFGGLPSWLLREKDIKVRTNDDKFMKPVTRYFNALLTLLAALQFTRGGPIIAFQIENEYASTKVGNNPVDKTYLQELKNLMENNKIVELLFTSDGISSFGNASEIPGVLMTANFQSDPEKEFRKLLEIQPGKPLMSMEYWTGWFDHWSEKHHTRNDIVFENVLRRILEFPASVNMYMFHGGTNWGFMNGANIADGSTDNKGFQPDTTSYDYDAPLSEAGDYTNKYVITRNLISRLNDVQTKLPTPPHLIPRVVYDSAPITEQLTLTEIEEQAADIISSPDLKPMELLSINNNSGQSYGYIVYKKSNINIPRNSVFKINGRVCDTVMVLINGELKSPILSSNDDLNHFGYWRLKDSTLNLGPQSYENATLELVVENWGRNNFGKLTQFVQFKGLWQGDVSINGQTLTNWDIIPLEFRKKWNLSLNYWHSVKTVSSPALYKAKFNVSDPHDTYIDMSEWTKGFVIINGFVLGRHAIIGPQLSLYLPSSFLVQGENEILVFEHFKPAKEVKFVTEPIFTSQTKNLPMEQGETVNEYFQKIFG